MEEYKKLNAVLKALSENRDSKYFINGVDDSVIHFHVKRINNKIKSDYDFNLVILKLLKDGYIYEVSKGQYRITIEGVIFHKQKGYRKPSVFQKYEKPLLVVFGFSLPYLAHGIKHIYLTVLEPLLIKYTS